MRSAFLGSAEQVLMMWAGDQMVNYADQDGMASAVYGMLSGGRLATVAQRHRRVHEHQRRSRTTRPPELNQRWAQMVCSGS